MRLRDFPATTARKFRTSTTWGAILVFGLLWTGFRLVTDLPRGGNPAMELVVPFAFVTGCVALGPIPWLWTGDRRRQAPPARGLLQALPWNALWLWAMVQLVALAAPLGPGPQHRVQLVVGRLRLDLMPQWGLFFFSYPMALILGWFLADKERAEASERELQALADRTRIQALQAQLTPHALFNVLAAITELVHEDPDAAEEALVSLVELYRALTRHGSAAQVPLREERALIRRYLDIEAIRLGDRLQVEWDWPSWADELRVPPLLLQPLVENAIKHGIAPATGGGRLRIRAGRERDALVLEVANTGQPLAPEPVPATGLGNLEARLRLMPRLEPGFSLRQEGGWVTARLALAWNWNP
jgi:hypothetical protein